MKKMTISILGSTGSIGTQTLEVLRSLNSRGYDVRVAALAAGRNIDLLEAQAREFRPGLVSVETEEDARELAGRLNGDASLPKTVVMYGDEGLTAVAESSCDMLVTAIVGMKGLLPTLAAIRKGTDIALANKETMVVAGEIVTREAKARGVRILPVDSEHSAIMQSLAGNRREDVDRIILTASGGPFRTWAAEDMGRVTIAEVLAHPTWKMGGKITVDCASMMNKGLEVIEARWLFDMPYEKIDILVHPQSIVHSMVQYRDGAIIAQLGAPDMKIPIQLALTFPERAESAFPRVDLTSGALTFEKPDYVKFRCLALARQAALAGGTCTAVLNGANEAAVGAFLAGKIPFSKIPELVDEALTAHKPVYNVSVEDIIAADSEARKGIDF